MAGTARKKRFWSARRKAWRAAPASGGLAPAVSLAVGLLVAGLLLIALSAEGAAQPAQPGWLHPIAEAPVAPREAFTFSGDFTGGHESKDLSALACASPQGWAERFCLLVSDDVGFVRQVRLQETTLTLGTRIPLVSKDKEKEEADAEGAVFLVHPDGRAFYYVTGSHGATRSSGAYQEARFRVFRIPEDPGSGKLGEPVPTAALAGVIAQVPELREAACTATRDCTTLADTGLTIEGLAAKGETLYFGLRAPVGADGRAYVLGVDADRLFAGKTDAPQVLRPRLGPAFGIRDLVAVEGGFLILAGLAVTEPKDEATLSIVYFWDGTGEETQPLAVLRPSKKKAHPEALLVLADEPDKKRYRLLVISDGVKEGDPAEYVVPRP